MMGSLIGHVLYGSLLGIIASAPEPRVAHAEPQPSGDGEGVDRRRF